MFSNDLITLYVIFGLALMVIILAEAINKPVLRYYSKPLLMPCLLVYYWILSPDASYLVMGALWFAFLGDVFLMFSTRKIFFILGLGSFLLCHIFYIIYFIRADMFPSGVPALFWLALIAYVTAGTTLYMMLKRNLGDMKLPVIIYIFTILFMSFLCAARYYHFKETAFWHPFAGSLLFIISDAILAFNHFKKTIRFSGVLVMSTYILAQLLIIFGILAEQFN
jgi:uncharacterized membrane protein YhhN